MDLMESDGGGLDDGCPELDSPELDSPELDTPLNTRYHC